ncbi:major tail protein [Mycobacterium phage Neos5]|nr:major tail protein [Mycobacterium phage Chandler]AKF14949.1 major tail protein [Mycobacterium phage OrangeOswald]AKG94820.1 major tail protein [Mycobacterium phage Corofin]AVJ49285.1 major tail protein [Mycobacterium phage ChaChing]AVJ50557.1 major tail protein [Mycobacterium phage Nozo]AWY03736.1 major tail protein [Mycobacterium phage Mortcellus]QGH76061.1 major tail protein [Mycobacterium phage Abinghost]QJD51419.1 major tail protein [Mycobacterium phage Jackstina]QYW01634.1 major tai
MSGVFPVVRGIRMRATKVNSCGLPISGPANRIVTDGFVTFNIDPVLKDAEELSQTNAAGKECVTDRTPPERKWYNIQAELCGVNTGLITLLNGWPQILDYDDNPIGFRDQKEVDDQFGVAFEVWTGGKSDDDCPTPTSDSIFSAPSSGLQYGYFLIAGKEFTLGAINIGAQVSTFTLSGISIAIPHWGRGPYNVAATDASGTPGRLLEPMDEDSHFAVFRTPVAPPEVTNGGEPLPLDILGKFVAPNYYFGGSGGEPAADVAPDQDEGTAYTLGTTGSVTAGTLKVKVNGVETAAIDWDATASEVKDALVAVDDGHGAADWTVTDGPLPGDVEIVPPAGVVLTLGTVALTGGSASLSLS